MCHKLNISVSYNINWLTTGLQQYTHQRTVYLYPTLS